MKKKQKKNTKRVESCYPDLKKNNTVLYLGKRHLTELNCDLLVILFSSTFHTDYLLFLKRVNLRNKHAHNLDFQYIYFFVLFSATFNTRVLKILF